jgi:zinc protease
VPELEADVPLPVLTWASAGEIAVGRIAVESAVVEMRIVIQAGSAADGAKPGRARLAVEAALESLSAAPRNAQAKLDAMGARLRAEVTPDATVVSLTVPKAEVGPALALVGPALAKPSFTKAEVERARTRLAASAASSMVDPSFVRERVMRRELFTLPTGTHGYAAQPALENELSALTEKDARSFAQERWVESAFEVIAAGTVALEPLRAEVAKSFAGASKAPVQRVEPDAPDAPEGLGVALVDRAGFPTCLVAVAMLAPEHTEVPPAHLAVVAQLVTGPTSSLASSTVLTNPRYVLFEARSGPRPLVFEVTTPCAKSGEALSALLGRIDAIARTTPTPDDVALAARAARLALAARWEGAARAADRAAEAEGAGREAADDEVLRKALRGELPNVLVARAAADVLKPSYAVVVAQGDAAVAGPLLAEFGEVKVLDPTQQLARTKLLAKGPANGGKR